MQFNEHAETRSNQCVDASLSAQDSSPRKTETISPNHQVHAPAKAEEPVAARGKLHTTKRRIEKIERSFGLSYNELYHVLNVTNSFYDGLGNAELHTLADSQSRTDRKIILEFKACAACQVSTLMTIGFRQNAELIMHAVEPSPWMFEALYEAMKLPNDMKLKSGQFLDVKLSCMYEDPSSYEKIGPSLQLLVVKSACNCGMGSLLYDAQWNFINLFELVKVDMTDLDD